jgi:hypothetical protein
MSAKKKPKALKSVHIQARLHPRGDNPREGSAIEVYRKTTADFNWTDREYIREASIALGQMLDAGWKPITATKKNVINGEAMALLRDIYMMIQQVASMDFSHARTHDGQPVDQQQIRAQLANIDRTATDILGSAIVFDDDDE